MEEYELKTLDLFMKRHDFAPCKNKGCSEDGIYVFVKNNIYVIFDIVNREYHMEYDDIINKLFDCFYFRPTARLVSKKYSLNLYDKNLSHFLCTFDLFNLFVNISKKSMIHYNGIDRIIEGLYSNGFRVTDIVNNRIYLTHSEYDFMESMYFNKKKSKFIVRHNGQNYRFSNIIFYHDDELGNILIDILNDIFKE